MGGADAIARSEGPGGNLRQAQVLAYQRTMQAAADSAGLAANPEAIFQAFDELLGSPPDTTTNEQE